MDPYFYPSDCSPQFLFPVFWVYGSSFVPPAPWCPDQIPEEKTEKKKYERTWTKNEVEEIYRKTQKFCRDNCRSIEELELYDFVLIGNGKRQNPEEIMKKIKEVNQNGTLRPGNWSKEEDSLLEKLVKENQIKWGEIARFLNKEIHNKLGIRNAKSCRERWNNYLNPFINRGKWTKEEDRIIMKGYLEHGNKWKTIKELVSNRLEGSLKNRVKSLLNKLRKIYKEEQEVRKKIKEIYEV